MNTSLTAYTHLESLLLFQSLNAYGIGNHVFSKISELLKNNPSVNTDKRFQSGRLSPDALRNFCLELLKEEVLIEQRQDGVEGDGQNGDARNSRKRKASAERYPTVQEAAQHQHLIPKLVEKLYARYRTAIVHEIRDDEDRYERLQRELQSIQRGERDSELLERANGRSPSLPRKSPLLHQKPVRPSPSPKPIARDVKKPGTPLANTPVVDGPEQPAIENRSPLVPPNGQLQTNRNGEATPIVVPGTIEGGPASRPPVPSPRPTQLQVPPPGQPLALERAVSPQPQFTVTEYPEPVPRPPRSPSPRKKAQPPAQVPQDVPPPATPQSLNPPRSQPLPAPPHPVSAPMSAPSTQFQPHPMASYRGNGGPLGPMSGPMPGPPPSFSPATQQFRGQYPPGPQTPGVQTPHQQRSYPSPAPPSYPPMQQPQMAQPLPQGGFMLPPFQVSPQDPLRAMQPAAQYSPVSTPLARQSHTVTATPSASTIARQALPQLQPQYYRSPMSTPRGMNSPYSANGTPRSAKTLWKKSMVRNFPPSDLPPRPKPEPLTDLVPPEHEPPKKKETKAKAPRKPRAKAKGKEKETEKEAEKEHEGEPEPEQVEEQAEEPVEEPVPEIEPRKGRSRRKATTKRTRLGSIASSQAGGSLREPSRSQSVISHTETVAGENESQAGTRVKTERGTPFDTIDEAPSTPSQPATRRRGGNQPRGRKRTAREASLAESEEQPAPETSEQRGTPGPSKVVIAPRRFGAMSSPIMNDINSHKHASTFTTAVKAKNAEGYYDIIKRPTDLKSISKAIANGSKIINAATASDTPAGSPGLNGGIVELPLTADVIPPKAIVNSAQLENELMRMFVNAVMFNPGEEGVVEDAREMFESVEKSVNQWRNAERMKGGGDGGSGMGTTPVPVAEEEGQGPGKKRKV